MKYPRNSLKACVVMFKFNLYQKQEQIQHHNNLITVEYCSNVVAVIVSTR